MKSVIIFGPPCPALDETAQIVAEELSLKFLDLPAASTADDWLAEIASLHASGEGFVASGFPRNGSEYSAFESQIEATGMDLVLFRAIIPEQAALASCGITADSDVAIFEAFVDSNRNYSSLMQYIAASDTRPVLAAGAAGNQPCDIAQRIVGKYQETGYVPEIIEFDPPTWNLADRQTKTKTSTRVLVRSRISGHYYYLYNDEISAMQSLIPACSERDAHNFVSIENAQKKIACDANASLYQNEFEIVVMKRCVEELRIVTPVGDTEVIRVVRTMTPTGKMEVDRVEDMVIPTA